MTNRIEDYALIGDLETAALVGIDGSIDWCCVPRFDSPSCFASLLGDEENGFWRIAPVGEVRASRAYRKDSLVLETRFEVDGGAVTVIDFMPLKKGDTSIIRIVKGESGRVDMRMDLVIRFDYGDTVPWVRRADFGLIATSGPNAIELRTPVPLEGKDFHTYSTFSVEAGESVPFTFCYHPSLAPPLQHDDADGACTETTAWWQEWAQGCTYVGDYRDAVVRSLITLKALTHRPSGGIVAAATTSLPEVIGGERNWDYRFCWLRDATFTLYALMTSGMTEEALAWREWLLRVAAGKPSQLQTLYGPTGERLLTEFEIGWLAGYEGSRPIRVGNQAHRQLQLDVFGEIMDVFHVSRRSGLADDGDSWALQKALIDFIETGWREPDNGIWEVRGPRRHFTHSKVMAWVALDRAIKAVEVFGLGGDVRRWKQLRQTIHKEVCLQGFNSNLNSFTQYYGSDRLDASLLMLPWVGFLPPNDPRCLGTVAAIERRLLQNGLVRRYETSTDVEGVHGSEGAFLSCTFWLADNYALMGRTAEAEVLFTKLLGIRNDVGLLAEEYDPIAKRQLGNFPQALSHISLINTAHNLTPTSPAVHRASS